MIDELNALESKALDVIGQADAEAALREHEVHFLGKKGALTAILRGMRNVEPAQRPIIGQRVNEVRSAVQAPSQIAEKALSVRASKRCAMTRTSTPHCRVAPCMWVRYTHSRP